MSAPILCDWHRAVVEGLMTDIVGDVEKARADVSAALARSCPDCSTP